MDPLKPDEPTGAQGLERPEKPLGRGLEQVSHLFLSPKPNTRRMGDPPTTPKPGQPAAPGLEERSILLQPSTALPKTRIVAMVRQFQDALEEGLHVIDVLLPCHPYGEMDLLAVDRANQLVIVDFETGLNDGLVLRGLAHCEWLVHNLQNVRRMHSGQTLQLSTPPRLLLLAPRFSALALGAARQFIRPQVKWVRYQVLHTGSAMGIFFEPVEPG